MTKKERARDGDRAALVWTGAVVWPFWSCTEPRPITPSLLTIHTVPQTNTHKGFCSFVNVILFNTLSIFSPFSLFPQHAGSFKTLKQHVLKWLNIFCLTRCSQYNCHKNSIWEICGFLHFLYGYWCWWPIKTFLIVWYHRVWIVSFYVPLWNNSQPNQTKSYGHTSFRHKNVSICASVMHFLEL